MEAVLRKTMIDDCCSLLVVHLLCHTQCSSDGSLVEKDIMKKSNDPSGP